MYVHLEKIWLGLQMKSLTEENIRSIERLLNLGDFSFCSLPFPSKSLDIWKKWLCITYSIQKTISTVAMLHTNMCTQKREEK